MNIAIELDDFDKTNVFYHKPVKNTVLNHSSFQRINYSNELLTFNGVFVKFSLNVTSKEKHYSKYKCSYDVSKNEYEIEKLKQIENEIIECAMISDKQATHKIYQQLNSGNIKLFSEICDGSLPKDYIIKISGVWKTDEQYGITYKFLDALEFNPQNLYC